MLRLLLNICDATYMIITFAWKPSRLICKWVSLYSEIKFTPMVVITAIRQNLIERESHTKGGKSRQPTNLQTKHGKLSDLRSLLLLILHRYCASISCQTFNDHAISATRSVA